MFFKLKAKPVQIKVYSNYNCCCEIVGKCYVWVIKQKAPSLLNKELVTLMLRPSEKRLLEYNLYIGFFENKWYRQIKTSKCQLSENQIDICR